MSKGVARAKAQYTAAHWGLEPQWNEPKPVDAPGMKTKQALWAMGKLRALHFEDGSVLRASRPYPYLAIGERDNKIYFVGPGELAMSRDRKWGAPETRRVVTRIDYDAYKQFRRGEEDKVYWYHEHEPPYPTLVVGQDGRPRYLGGGYTVRAEGICK